MKIDGPESDAVPAGPLAALVATASADTDADGTWNTRANAQAKSTPAMNSTTNHTPTHDATMNRSTNHATTHHAATNHPATAYHSSSANSPTPTDAD